jgi:hypothetical protein
MAQLGSAVNATSASRDQAGAVTSSDAASVRLAELIGGAQIARMISVAAELGIADLLEDGPRSHDDLASATGTHAPSLYRLLRALASLSIFTESDDGRFSLTPMADSLRTKAPQSLRGLALFQNDDWYWEIYRDLPYSLRTGCPATTHLWSKSLFEYLAVHPEAAQTFDDGMASRHAANNQALVHSLDLSDVSIAVDVGGGNGSLLAVLLAAHRRMRGVLFDLPSALAHAPRVLSAAGVADRCDICPGDFFHSVPAGGDVYLLSNILHDWSDDRARLILRNIHSAMGPDSRMLVTNEQVLPTGNDAHPGKLGDVTMLLIGGRERTRSEWEELFVTSGFVLSRIIAFSSRTGPGIFDVRRA